MIEHLAEHLIFESGHGGARDIRTDDGLGKIISHGPPPAVQPRFPPQPTPAADPPRRPAAALRIPQRRNRPSRERKSVVEGKSVSVRVDLGGRGSIKKKKKVKKKQK